MMRSYKDNDIWKKIYSVITQKTHTIIELNMVMRDWGEILGQPIGEVHARDELYRNLLTQIECFKVEANLGNEWISGEVIGVLRKNLKVSDNDIKQLTEKYGEIFISHSSKDEKYVLALVEFLEDIGLSEDRIFCTSIAQYGVPLGEDFNKRIKEKFINNDIFVLFVLSDNYYESPACLNEMGAAWVLQKDYMSFLLPGFKYEQIEGAIDPTLIAIKMDDKQENVEYRLKEFRNKMIEFFQLESIEKRKWNRYMNDFLNKLTNRRLT